MARTIFLAMVFLGYGSIVVPAEMVKAQEKERHSLDISNETLTDVLHRVSKVFRFDIRIKGEWNNRRISARFANASLPDILNRLFQGINHVEIWDWQNRRVTLTVYETKGSWGDITIAERPGPAEEGVRTIIIPPENPAPKNMANESEQEGPNMAEPVGDISGNSVLVTGTDTDFVQGTKTTAP